MQNLLRRLESIVALSKSFGYAVLNIAEDLGIPDIGYDKSTACDIPNVIPSDENISATEFRLAVATAIVRSFAFNESADNEKDTGKVLYFRGIYDRLCAEDELSGAAMNAYHNMMFRLHPQPVKIDDPNDRKAAIDHIILEAVAQGPINFGDDIARKHPEFTFDEMQTRAWYLSSVGAIKIDHDWLLTKDTEWDRFMAPA